jgi:hypothetical protein
MKRWRVGDVQRLGAGGGAGETWGVAFYDSAQLSALLSPG